PRGDSRGERTKGGTSQKGEPPSPEGADRRGTAAPLLRLFLRLDRILDQFRTLPEGGGDEIPEQRVRTVRPGTEFGVELGGHKPRMVLQFDNLHQPAVRGGSRKAVTHPFQLFAILVVEFIPVAMP